MTKKTRTRRNHNDYEFDIPEREAILKYLRDSKQPRSLKHIAQYFDINRSEQRAALNKRLKAMLHDGELIRNRKEGYGLLDKMDLIAGTVIRHHDGYGFLRSDEQEQDMFLPIKEMRSLMHGDKVIVRLAGYDRKKRRQAALVEILERAHAQIVGRYFLDKGISFVVADNKRIHQYIFIPKENRGKAKSGQYVVVNIVKQPDRYTQAVGKVVEIIGKSGDPKISMEVAIRAYELPYKWPETVRQEIKLLQDKSVDTDYKREDLCNLPFVTIDGEDARDFDDAVYCEKTGQGWRLLVAIADVSHYISPGSAIDEEAKLRGTSVYFPQSVIPMLPEILSNDLCSLKPDVARLAMVCELQIDKQGEVKQYRFFQGVIQSALRMTYTEVASIIIDKNNFLNEKQQKITNNLNNLYHLYKLMHARRLKHGLLDFDATESRLVFDKKGVLIDIHPLHRNDAHRLIEECMLATNVAAADFLQQQNIPALYRNHEIPAEEKLADLREFLAELGLNLTGGETPNAKDYTTLIETVKNREDAHLIETVLLRSMPMAYYDEKNLGHFGLAFDAYTHFTSPIRRYPDLLVHRAVKHIIMRQKNTTFPYNTASMHILGESSSMTERRAEEATRDVIQRLKCEYMQDKIGEVFDGVVSSVTGFGLFVELDDIYIEGLVHVTSLPADYYHFDPIGHRLVGERTRAIYRLANRIKVQLVRVDVDEKKIDFELAK